MGAVVVRAWDYACAFVLAGSISLFAGFVATFLRPPGRRRKGRLTASPQPISRDMG
ncbi:hypothetical protein ACWGJT_01805 [Streptomyces xantholiticus]